MIARLHSFCFSLNCLFALMLVPTAVLAQGTSLSSASTTAEKPSAAAEFLIQAAKSYGPIVPGAGRWHLKASFAVLDEQENPKEQGSYEELWSNFSQYKRSFTSPSFTQTQYSNGKGLLITGDRKSAPMPLDLIHTAFISTMPSDGVLTKLLIVNQRATADPEELDLDGTHLHCYRVHLTRSPDASRFQPRYCFDENDALTRFTFDFPFVMGEASFSNPVRYQGHILPGDMDIFRDGKRVLKVHLEGIEPLNASDAEFDAPADAGPPVNSPLQVTFGGAPPPAGSNLPPRTNLSANVVAGPLISKVNPIYPPEAEAARISGTVVLQVTISKEGRIANLHVISGPEMLRMAALEAVKQWVYRPYLLNNRPIEVVTTINVLFRLPE